MRKHVVLKLTYLGYVKMHSVFGDYFLKPNAILKNGTVTTNLSISQHLLHFDKYFCNGSRWDS